MNKHLLIELKQYCFALYIGQNVFMYKGVSGPAMVQPHLLKAPLDDCLHLHSLSSITDHEAIEVAKIAYAYLDENCIVSCVPNADNIHSDIKSVEIQQFINLPPVPKYYKCCHIQIDLVDYDINLYRFTNDGKDKKDDVIGSEQQVYAYQYLQQQSFALPIYFKGVQYSVERLIELGIYQITELKQ